MSLRHLVPGILSLCLGALLYIYWRESAELHDSRLANKQLQKELTSSRSERDQVQFRLNLLRDDVASAQRAREESDRHVQELDEQLQEERGKLVCSPAVGVAKKPAAGFRSLARESTGAQRKPSSDRGGEERC